MFEHSFMIRAFFAGGMIACIAPVIGMFLVHRRMSFLVDTLAHVSLSGVALGLLLAWNPIIAAVITAIIGALVVEQLRTSGKLEGDSALVFLLYGSLGIASILISVTDGPGVHLESLLFGSILTVRPFDLVLIGLLVVVVLATVFLLYKQLFCLVYDEEWAQTSGLPIKRLNIILIILGALTVAVSMRIVGVLLVGALMTIPVIIASAVRLGFLRTLLLSVLISLVSVGSGITISYHVGLPSGGTIVLVLLGFATILGLVKKYLNFA